ncbi:histone-like nucleoid-structuring protein [Stenotrophomonas maltophilia]|nr:histone-like nucleoid-structuring protein [Stenotrophomonas maltophilia]OBU69419.1 histone-like nucleoid-structuring protein [Stenotrophomonas maltophilia]
MSLTTLKSLNAEIKQLEAQKELVERRDGEVPQALAVLKKYAKVLTAAQCRQLNKIIVASVGASVVGAAKSAGSPVKGRSLGRVAPKYRLPTGETWTGRGLQPKVFGAWANSAEGKAWRAANQGEKYPSADKANPVLKTGTAVPKKARKVRTKTSAVKTPAKKRARKAARSSGRKGDKG